MHPPPRMTLNHPLHARARGHFQMLATVIARLRQALAEVRIQMKDLADQYRSTMAPCRLVLYLKKGRDGEPRALYWGRTFKLETLDGIRRVRKHLRGPLTNRRIYHIAWKFEERELFHDFDRRRLCLNAAYRRIALPLGRIRRGLATVRIPPQRIPEAQFEDAELSNAYRLAWACAAVEDDMIQLARQRLPVINVSPVFPYVTTTKHSYVAMGWAFPEKIVRGGRLVNGRRHATTKLTGDFLRAPRIPTEVRRELRTLDHSIQQLRSEHRCYARVLGRIRRLGRTVGSWDLEAV